MNIQFLKDSAVNFIGKGKSLIQQHTSYIEARKTFAQLNLAMREENIDLAIGLDHSFMIIYRYCLSEDNQLLLRGKLNIFPEEYHTIVVSAAKRQHHHLRQAAHKSDADRIKFENFDRWIHLLGYTFN